MTDTTVTQDRYAARGVSTTKSGVHAAVKNLDRGMFPGAFCNVFPYHGAETVVHHSDGSGSKIILAYLLWKETGDLDWFRRSVQDSFVMNSDDIICVGHLGPYYVNLTINRNKFLIPDEVVAVLIDETRRLCDMFTGFGITCYYTGGETADLADNTRTITIDHNFFSIAPKESVIDASNMRPGDYLVGFSSRGQADWESEPNSGIGSNGLTSARHELLSAHYRQYLETFAPEQNPDLVYTGKYRLADMPGVRTVGDALTSRTRTYAPLVLAFVERFGAHTFSAFIHCSGGGQTKIGKFGPAENQYLIANQIELTPVFEEIQAANRTDWKEMYKTFNMGCRFIMACRNLSHAEWACEYAKSRKVSARIIGCVEERADHEAPRVCIQPLHGKVLEYYDTDIFG